VVAVSLKKKGGQTELVLGVAAPESGVATATVEAWTDVPGAEVLQWSVAITQLQEGAGLECFVFE